MSHNNGQVIQASFGPLSCGVVSHLLNLQGLDACDETATHTTTATNNRVPRVILVDEPSSIHQRNNNASGYNICETVTWQQDKIEIFDTHNASNIVNGDDFCRNQPVVQKSDYTWSRQFRQLANDFSLYSQQPTRTQQQPASYSSQGRHINWDDELEEEDNEDDEELRKIRERSERDTRMQKSQAAVQQSRELWRTQFQAANKYNSDDINGNVDQSDGNGSKSTTNNNSINTLSWLDYFAPPYLPKSIIALPFDVKSSIAGNWASYTAAAASNDSMLMTYKEDVLLEQARHFLEDCDNFQGLLTFTDGGVYAGLATSFQQYIQEECPKASKLVIDFSRRLETAVRQVQTLSEKNTQLCHKVETGLAYHDWVQLSSVILPLSVNDTFVNKAQTAANLEAVTAPWRHSSRNDRLVGLNNNDDYFDDSNEHFMFGTTKQLSFTDWLRQMQPSSQYSVLELDGMRPGSIANDDLASQLLEGTSIERDARVKYGRTDMNGKKQQHSDPGTWLESTNRNGILSSLSYDSETVDSRESQSHFALSTSLRSFPLPKLSNSSQDVLLCLMQGMSIRYRPENSMSCHIQSSLATLTDNTVAGSYWSFLWNGNTATTVDPVTVLSVLGNSTRSYKSLLDKSEQLKWALSSRMSGVFQRNSGISLPEWEDCEEALGTCYSLRDAYRPSIGRGYESD